MNTKHLISGLVAFIFLAGAVLAQTPPYIKNPITTNTPSGMTNVVSAIAGQGVNNSGYAFQSMVDSNWVLGKISSIGLHVYSSGTTNGAIGATGRTNNWQGFSGPSFAIFTNTLPVNLADNAYIRHVVSTQTFTRIESGPMDVELWAFETGAGTVSIHPEAYLYDTIAGTLAEMAVGPPVVINGTTPLLYQWSLSTIGTNLANPTKIVLAWKVDAAGAGSSLSFISGGAYDSHMSFVVSLGNTLGFVVNPITTNPPSGMTNVVAGASFNGFSTGGQLVLSNATTWGQILIGNTTLTVPASTTFLLISNANNTVETLRLAAVNSSLELFMTNEPTARLIIKQGGGITYLDHAFYANYLAIRHTGVDKMRFYSNAITMFVPLEISAIATVPITNASAALLYAKTNSGIVELYTRGSDGVETQISPHADDAPSTLYDGQKGMKEMIWREESPFLTNGMVSFINLRRMARITELNTRAILYLAGNNNASMSNALVTLQGFSPAARQVLLTETFAEYNARTTNNLVPLSWDTVEVQRQIAYDAERALLFQQATWITETNAILIAAGNTNLLEVPIVPPVKNIKRAKPAWMSL